MNGTWSLYVVDDTGTDSGSIINGWKLTFEANDYACSVTTAAYAEVSGRVLTSEGRGLTNAKVLITDEHGDSRSVVTGRLGTFAFADVEVGHTYVLSIGSRRFIYAPKIIQVTDNISGIEFTPEH